MAAAMAWQDLPVTTVTHRTQAFRLCHLSESQGKTSGGTRARESFRRYTCLEAVFSLQPGLADWWSVAERGSACQRKTSLAEGPTDLTAMPQRIEHIGGYR